MVINNIEIRIIRKKIKNMYLTVHREDGSVEVKAPMRMPQAQIERFVKSKMHWIIKHREEFAKQEKVRSIHYRDGEKVPYLGTWYPLKVHEYSGRNMIRMEEETLHILVKERYEEELGEKQMEAWYREKLYKILPNLVETWEKKMGVHAKEIRVRKMKTRWGTCNVVDHRIWVSLELAKYPLDCLEYIVVHELAHLLEPSHNQVFHQIMTKYLPDWKLRKKRLNEMIWRS